MMTMPKSWDEMPSGVKKAIVFLFTGWIAHYLFYFGFMAEGTAERITYLNLGVGIGICYCVATIRKWARRMCIFFNIGMVVMYTWAAVIFGWAALVFAQDDKLIPLILTVVASAAFGLSLYFMLQKETGQFFAPPEKDKESEPEDSARRI